MYILQVAISGREAGSFTTLEQAKEATRMRGFALDWEPGLATGTWSGFDSERDEQFVIIKE